MALKWLHNLKNPTGRLARWALELPEFDYEVTYRKGSSNLVPDAFSRSYETTKSTAIALACIVEKPIAEIYDKTDDWYSAKMKYSGKYRKITRIGESRILNTIFSRPDPLKSSVTRYQLMEIGCARKMKFTGSKRKP